MKYKVKPYIQVDKIEYQTLITEIMNLSLEEINFIIEDMNNVFAGKYAASSFSGQHMAIVDFNRDIATIRYFDDLIGKESTLDVYNMLKSYQRILIECNNIGDVSD